MADNNEIDPRQEVEALRLRLIQCEQSLADMERLKAELADLRHLSRTAMNTTSDSVVVLDPSGTILAINEYGARRLRLEPEDLIGANVFHYLPQEVIPRRKQWLKEAAEARKPLQFKDSYQGAVYGHRFYPLLEPRTNTLRIGVATRDITQGEQAMRALRESEARYRAILEDQTELICRYLPDGRLSYVNEAYARYFGRDRRELINTNFVPHIPREDQEIIDRQLAQLSRDNPVTSFEHRVIMENGDVHWQHWVHRAIFDERGALAEFQAVGRSIDKRKRTQEALLESERRFRTLFEESPISLWEEDFSLVKEHFDSLRRNGKTDLRAHFENDLNDVRNCASLVGILEVNRATLRFLEADTKLDVMRGLAAIFPDQAMDVFREELIALAEGKRVFESEIEHFTLRNRKRHALVHLVVAPGYEDTLGRVIVSIIDVTERKQAEEELDANRAFLHQIIDTVPSPIFVKDRTGAFVLVNKAMAEMYGTSVTEMIGKRGSDFNPHEDETGLFRVEDLEVLDSHKPIFIPQRVVTHSNGVMRWYSTIKLPLAGKDQVLGVAMDITERKEAEAERQNMEKHFRQSQKMQALGTLAGGIAHDFNNMIFAILGFVRLARKKAPESGKLADYLDQIHSAGMRASELVRQILTFSRQTEQEKKPVHLSPLFMEVGKMIRATLPSTIELAIDIAPDCEGDEDTVLGDPIQIHQVLMNLCTNASHSMGEHGGRLGLSLSSREISAEAARAMVGQTEGKFLEIRVSDTGHGIDPAIIEQIFDPFFTTKAPGEGTGMGLSVVHGIIKSHGGTVHVESKPGQGTTFTVLLPKLVDSSCMADATDTSIPGGDEHILFVDDEGLLVQMVEELLANLGYTVTARTSPSEALELFKNAPAEYDLVITDQTMPEMTGMELTRKILDVRPDTPVILLTGYSEGLTEESVARTGICEFIMKPVVEEQIAQTIRHVLDQRPKGREYGQAASC